MRGEIRRLKGNLRYRILNINEDYYLIDTGSSPWKALAPLLFWIFSNPGYKIDKETALRLLTNQQVKPFKNSIYGVIGAGIAISFSGFLTSITDRLNINSSLPMNIIITIFMVILTVSTFLFILKRLKKNVEENINYTELPERKIKISLPKISHLITISIISLFFAAFSFAALVAFVQHSNLFILLLGLIMLLLFLFLGGIALDHGKYKIKFK
ncbi:DUF443 family protein [Terribacillus saccharophilus]|uniref:DUF443 family protein n=1 Tax=Terribacillus saccharophilus TaxID=361277 RepID=UPI000C9AF35E|nr:DUF443 family protein [Terribacillus goriensis]